MEVADGRENEREKEKEGREGWALSWNESKVQQPR